MEENKKQIISRFKSLFEREYVIPFASGTQALSFVIEASTNSEAHVGISDANCVNVLQAVLYSGRRPVILPTDLAGNICLKKLQNIKLDAIVGVSQFASLTNRRSLKKYCDINGLRYIDDCCRNYFIPLTESDKKNFIDPTIISFGAGKIIQNNSGGAIVLTNSKPLFEKLCIVVNKYKQGKFEHSKDAHKALSDQHTLLYNLYYKLGRFADDLNLKTTKELETQISSYKKKLLSLRQDFIIQKFEGFEVGFEDKVKFFHTHEKPLKYMGDQLIEFLSNKVQDTLVFERIGNETYWRPSALIPRRRNELMIYLWNKGYSVSSWPAPLHIFFGEYFEGAITAESKTFFDSIVNFDIRQPNAKAYISEILNFLNR